MDTVEVWLVRHGETVANERGVLSGWGDVPLTERGREQARWLKGVLAGEAFDSVRCSDLDRARETARLAWGPAEATEALREIDFGELEAQPYAEIVPEHKDSLLAFSGFRPPGGETIEAFAARVEGFLDRLPPGRHLLFTHGGVLRAIMRLVGPDEFLGNGALMAVDWTGRRLLFVRPNAHATESAVVRESRRGA